MPDLEVMDRIVPVLTDLAVAKANFLSKRGAIPLGLVFRHVVTPFDKSARLRPPGEYLVIVTDSGSIRWVKTEEGDGMSIPRGSKPTYPLLTKAFPSDGSVEPDAEEAP